MTVHPPHDPSMHRAPQRSVPAECPALIHHPVLRLPAPAATDLFDSVVATALERLRHSGYWSLGRLSVEICENILILRGTVSSYYVKQLAQALLADLVTTGTVLRIENQVHVQDG